MVLKKELLTMGRLIWFCLSLIFEIYEKAENNDKTQVIQIPVFAYKYEQKMSDHNKTKVSKLYPFLCMKIVI